MVRHSQGPSHPLTKTVPNLGLITVKRLQLYSITIQMMFPDEPEVPEPVDG